MIPSKLQDDLCDEITQMLSDRTYKNTAGEQVPMNVYPQNIPIPESDDDSEPIPYIIVRLNTGEDNGTSDSAYTVKLVVIIGLYDDDLQAQGHRDLLNIIDLLYERFKKNPNLKGKYVFQGNYKWSLQEDGYYPYYFGAVEMNFAIPAIRREDALA